jgi:signal peptidase
MISVFGKIFYGLFILLLLAVAALFLATLLPIPGNVEVKIVKSGSMEPAIKTGSVVVVKPAGAYAEGDVITFGQERGEQIPTTHRIVSVVTENAERRGLNADSTRNGEAGQVFYLTKGDANEEADNVRIAASEVVGKVIFTVPYAGYVLDFARKPIGFTLMIGVPAAVIILDELSRIFKEVAGMRRKRRETHEITRLYEQ